MATMSFEVSGMSCEHCTAAVRDEVASIDGVVVREVDLASGRLTVESVDALDGDSVQAAVKAAVEEAGYEFAVPT